MDSSSQAHLHKSITQCYRQDGQYQAVPGLSASLVPGPWESRRVRRCSRFAFPPETPWPSFAASQWVCYWVALCCYDSEMNSFLSLRSQGSLYIPPLALSGWCSSQWHPCWGGLIWSLGLFTK